MPTHLSQYFAPWCGHCKRLAPTWAELAEAVKSNADIQIAKVDCTTDRDICTDAEVRLEWSDLGGCSLWGQRAGVQCMPNTVHGSHPCLNRSQHAPVMWTVFLAVVPFPMGMM